MKNWQTTISGLGAIAAGVAVIWKYGPSDPAGLGLIAVGIGLLRAKDGNAHSTPCEVFEAGQKADAKIEAKAEAKRAGSE